MSWEGQGSEVTGPHHLLAALPECGQVTIGRRTHPSHLRSSGPGKVCPAAWSAVSASAEPRRSPRLSRSLAWLLGVPAPPTCESRRGRCHPESGTSVVQRKHTRRKFLRELPRRVNSVGNGAYTVQDDL